MSDRLERHIPGGPASERYGTWELASDREVLDPQGDDRLDPKAGSEWSEADDARVRAVIARQRLLSFVATTILVGSVIAVVAGGHLFPETLATPVWRGFSPAFLVLGILIYPLTWLVAGLFVFISNRIDQLP